MSGSLRDFEPSSCNPNAPGFADSVRRHGELDPETMQAFQQLPRGEPDLDWPDAGEVQSTSCRVCIVVWLTIVAGLGAALGWVMK